MKLNRLKHYMRGVLGVSVLVFAATGYAAAQSADANKEDTKQQDSDIEVIEVVGEDTLFMAKAVMRNRQTAFYEQLNSLVENEEFHVTCETVQLPQRLGSNVMRKEWQCTPNFVESINKDLNFESGKGELGLINQRIYSNEFKDKYNAKKQELMMLIQKALAESPELNSKYQSFLSAQQTFKQKHVEQFGGLSKHAADVEEATN